MNRANENTFIILLRASRPLSLAAGILFYALGGGIAAYLGENIDWPVYWIGQGMVTLLQLSSFFLREYFDKPGQPFQMRNSRSQRESENDRQVIIPRVVYLQIALTVLTVGAVFTVLLIAQGILGPIAFLFLGLAFILAFLYAVPPVRLVYSGYGELVLAIMLANLFPALAFLLQAAELHRLLAMMTFPLTMLFLSALLAQSLPTYLDDMKNSRQTMMIRLGWQRGMGLHNLLIAAAYIILAFSIIAGLPWRLGFPAFLSLPASIFQIWQINNIASGGKPRWRLLVITTIASVGMAAYFMNLALWTD